MSKLNLNTLISRNPEVVSAPVDQDLVMMGPKDELFYGVNPLGTELWQLLESGPKSFEQICEYIQKNYEVESGQCFQDAQKFIESMLDQEMVLID
jgi:hypothetical protein